MRVLAGHPVVLLAEAMVSRIIDHDTNAEPARRCRNRSHGGWDEIVFGLLSKLAEILASFGTKFLDGRRAAKDSDVAAELVRVALALQDLCLRGERLLALADEFVDDMAQPGAVEEFEGLLELQVKAVGELRTALINCQALLATIDAGFYLELAPFLDTKSGLITRWSQQVWQSRFSTTTLFFLQADSLQRVVEIGRAQANPKGLNRERSAYLMAVADGIRSARSHEVRDLRHAVARNNQPTVKSEIATARADLARTRVLCGHLLAATQEAVGPEVMARLRRTLVPQSRRD